MAQISRLLLLSLSVLVSVATVVYATSGDFGAYIIHMDKSAMPAPYSSEHHWHISTLSSLSSPEGIDPTHLYTYKHVMNGFSAILSRSHVEQLESLPGHVATYRGSFGRRATTHTPQFLGLNKDRGLWPDGKYGDDIIIGIVDSGVWPESESFNDYGMPPEGICETGPQFNTSHCNRKLIGARKFSQGMKKVRGSISTTQDYDSPRDYKGHGSHTASTAGGSSVQGADYFGYAKGTATGIAPLARLAMYKVMFYYDEYDCTAADTLAGMDQAIEDGVDVLSLSIAFDETPYDENPIAVAAFAALKKGIFVVCAAGNDGLPYTVRNTAPWITSVGAGTIDRDFTATVTVDEGNVSIIGSSIYPEDLLVSKVPVYYGDGNRSKEICTPYSLDPEDVEDKYVFCDYDEHLTTKKQRTEVFRAGAIGAILSSKTGKLLWPEQFGRPFVVVNPENGELVKRYLINTTNTTNTTVTIKYGKTTVGTKPAHNMVSPWILKPDILAPGRHILAAWVSNRGFVPDGHGEYLVTDYAIPSGTSMACPHIAGIAALLKAVHRYWSPATIRSAMMTTADVTDNANGLITDVVTEAAGSPLDFGSGHVNPNKAMDPGLVYDIGVEDYINYLCALNYTRRQIQQAAGISNLTCEHATLDLNYPSFIIILGNTSTISYRFKRVLTSVVDSVSTYQAQVEAPEGMEAIVQPSTITFQGKYSKAEFNLTVTINLGVGNNISITKSHNYLGNYGFLSWHEVNGTRVVKSPIVSAFSL
ncbi:hypothetical protein K2173_001125 [Erythroxylum novogranatense]|uniref:Uncharacterized protein n=1 Tax=Erythroxylum novogranatense TaxID=1862640 RepID=A0AAV8TKN4_9ROSI|nr:hypothetical protein K2173_001125 [Erythroxylum novogranatense]